MKVQASRELLKANLFLSPKKLNRRQSLHEIFLSAKIFSAYTSTLYFKMNMSTLFCCSLFFKVYDNPQVTINKSKQSVNYSLIPSGITSRTEPLIFLQIPYCSLSLSVSVCLPLSFSFLNFCQTCVCHHGLGTFSNLWCSDYQKMYVWVKKLRADIFTHALLHSCTHTHELCAHAFLLIFTALIFTVWHVTQEV